MWPVLIAFATEYSLKFSLPGEQIQLMSEWVLPETKRENIALKNILSIGSLIFNLFVYLLRIYIQYIYLSYKYIRLVNRVLLQKNSHFFLS